MEVKCAWHMKVTPTVWIRSFRPVDFSWFHVMVGWKWSRAIAVLQASLFSSDGCASSRKVQAWCNLVKNMPLPSQNYRGRKGGPSQIQHHNSGQLFKIISALNHPAFFKLCKTFFFFFFLGGGGVRNKEKKQSCMQQKVSPEQSASGINTPPPHPTSPSLPLEFLSLKGAPHNGRFEKEKCKRHQDRNKSFNVICQEFTFIILHWTSNDHR